MKTKVVGWMYLLASPLFLVGFIFTVVTPLLFSNGVLDSRQIPNMVFGIASLIFGLFSMTFGSALKAHKKWSWYIGIVLIPLVTIGNLITSIVNHNMYMMILVGINCFCVYALVSEKELFINFRA